MAAVLVIDDDPQYLKMVRAMLEPSGYDVRSASDGNDGIESFTLRRPDLVITDMIMPELDGIETIRVLRDLDPSVPIIAISGGSGSVLMIARSAGAVAALAKPFDAARLLDTVAGAMSPGAA